MKIKKGDNVLVIAGKDRGKTGKVMRALPQEMAIVVEGINIKKKHTRARREGEKGQVVSIPAAFTVSNVKIVCPKCGKATRVGFTVENDNKKRVCKKCKSEI